MEENKLDQPQISEAEKNIIPGTKKPQGHKALIAVIAVLSVLLFAAGGALAYQYLTEKISLCTPGGSGICYEIKEVDGKSKVNIKNLDPNLKYRLVVKRKVQGQEVEVGEVMLNMKEQSDKTKEKNCFPRNQSYGSRDYSIEKPDGSTEQKQIKCCNDLVLKDDFLNATEDPRFVCCKSTECAYNGACVASGYVITASEKSCQAGSWVDWSDDPNSITCRENDGGMNFNQKGRLFWLTQNFEADDVCIDATTLKEYYCESPDGMYREIEHTCENGCNDGACNAGSQDAACTDSDGGRNYYERGITEGSEGSASYSDNVGSDWCEGDVLKELYCNSVNNMVEMESYTCANGCSNGACVMGPGENTCDLDSDCALGYVCKASGRYGDPSVDPIVQKFCCQASECASVTSVSRCVGEGGEDRRDVPVIEILQCIGGEYYTKIVNSDDPVFGCYPGKELKLNYPRLDQLVCCNPEQCAAGDVCYDNGDALPDPAVYRVCNNGTWVE